METIWYLYILRCGDDTLYTGITTDVEKRLAAHRSGKGAKYTRGRQPLELVYRECCATHSDALKRELAVKKCSRQEKEMLIRQYSEEKMLENK
ncbi:MAG: GIY-YIG nuclease family protein [Oscillospiraceae bacterium]|nr:GIY-YIG nuclease family protein [Oscillospiraceae bacterium]